MEKRVGGFFAILFAGVPIFFVLLSHTSYWPEFFQQYTDVYIPQGPTKTFSDFSPSDRTDALRVIEGGVVVRPITGTPTYLLFKPRRETKYIRVEILSGGPRDIEIGYRTGETVETNTFGITEKMVSAQGDIYTARLPLDQMFVERASARRIVISIPGAANESEELIRQVRIVYED